MQRVTSSDGTQIAYSAQGQGAPVILVDGAMCYRGFGPMTPLAGHLAAHFTVFHYDRRGRGESGDTAPYAIEREVEDLDALIERAGGWAYVYGLSSGAALALAAAAHRSAIRKMVLYEPPFMVPGSRAVPSADTPERLSEFIRQGQPGAAVEHFMVNMVGLPVENVAYMRTLPVWPVLETVAPTLPYDATLGGQNRWAPPSYAAEIDVPTLVVDGENSPGWMHAGVDALGAAIPGALRRTLAGQDHEVQPEAIAPLLVEFFI